MGIRSIPVVVALAWLGVSVAHGQTRTVSGRVTDARSAQPIAVGEVSVQGTGIRDRLRPDGVFVLRVPLRDVTLVVRSLGYRARAITVPRYQETAFIELAPDPFELEGVVVSGRATSTVTLSGRDVYRVPAASLEEALQGKVAGVDIQQNSGAPAGDLQLRLRGVTTLLGAVSPLYVVDGTIVSGVSVGAGMAAVTGGQEPVPNRIVDLNPWDIESIEILKGAAAATMYGSKGSNGVVIIRTRRGRRLGGAPQGCTK